MLPLSIIAIVVIGLLCIINRKSVPGLAAFLYAVLGACVLMLIVTGLKVFSPSAVNFLSGTLASAAVLVFALAVGCFGLMGYQNRFGDNLLKVGYAVIAIVVIAISYNLGGDYAAYGAALGACLPIAWLLSPI